MSDHILWAVYAMFTQEGREIVRLFEDPEEATEFLGKCRDYKAKEPQAPDYEDLDVIYDKKWNEYCEAHQNWQRSRLHHQWQSCDSYEIEPIAYIPRKTS